MKKITIIFFLLIASIYTLNAEGGMVMQKSDWLHVTIPGITYVGSVQFLQICGVDKDIAEWGALSAGALCVLGWEYYYGVGTKEDIELGLTSLAIGFVLNKGVNLCLKK